MYGERLHALVLFGSQARGTAHDESDVDVLVVLDDGFRLYDEIKRVVDVQLELLDRHGELLSFKLMPVSRYRSVHHPLMMNVRQEGVVL
jgi:predicted nucleotidyltransferase